MLPSCLILRLIGATSYLALSLILWGALNIGMAFIKSAWALILVRSCLVSQSIGELRYFVVMHLFSRVL